jgi:hypothetical protein
MTEQTETRKRLRRPAPEVWEDPDAVLPFYTWAEKAGTRCVRLGERTLGVTLAEHRRWIKARTEAAVA